MWISYSCEKWKSIPARRKHDHTSSQSSNTLRGKGKMLAYYSSTRQTCNRLTHSQSSSLYGSQTNICPSKLPLPFITSPTLAPYEDSHTRYTPLTLPTLVLEDYISHSHNHFHPSYCPYVSISLDSLYRWESVSECRRYERRVISRGEWSNVCEE